ncbi:methyltransferase domain-containing protein [Streptomyces sp. NPDC059070]|uniref:methyltransferase domain-containing protein n=1 Tax=Streptomyces sp. NPDC059070 TaxID=3346713 RepID=UPI00367C1661
MNIEADARARAAEQLGGTGAFPQPWMREIFLAVPRHRFVPDTVWLEEADGYRSFTRSSDEDRWMSLVYDPGEALVTQVDDGRTPAGAVGEVPTSSISALGAVFAMLAETGLEPGHHVLEIGAGTGYNAALLAERAAAGQVTTVEIDPAVCAQARTALAATGYEQVTVVRADGEHGYPPDRPYDLVLSTAAVLHVPYAWVEQTRPGGVIVTPWRTAFCNYGLARLTVGADGTACGRFAGAMTFMTVRGQRPHTPITDLYSAERWQQARESLLAPDDLVRRLADPHAAFAVGLRLPGVAHWPQDGGHWWCSSNSWAHADDEGALHQWGPRDLATETARALDAWHADGRPTLFEYGLTVAKDATAFWLGDPGHPLPLQEPR